MKTAIYIEDGVTQLVLTPENDFEKDVVSKIGQGEQEVNIYNGSFYECRGGWNRQSLNKDESLILRLTMKVKA
jgi:hypothetical protein